MKKKEDTSQDEFLLGFNSLVYDNKPFEYYDPDSLRIKKGNTVYRSMMHDEQIKAVLSFKKSAIIARGYTFDICDDDETQEQIAAFFQHVIDQMAGSFSDKLKYILSGFQNGFSICEKVHCAIDWDGSPYWGLKDIKLKPWDTFIFEVDRFGNITSLKQQTFTGDEQKVPMEKVIYWVHQPDVDAYYGESDLRAAYRAWWSKDITIRFQNIHLERHGSGFPVITPDEKAGKPSADLKSKLLNILNNISARTGIYLPKHYQLTMVQPQKTEAYEKAVAQHDKSIAKAMMVPNLLGLSEQGNTGSYSQSQTQFDVFLWVIEDTCNSLAECLNEQLFAELAEWNFGAKDFPKFKFDPMTEAKKVELAKTWSDLVQKGAVINSVQDENYTRSLLGYPEKEVPEEDAETGEGVPDGDVEDIFLNGAQVTSLINLTSSVGRGEVTRATAIEVIVTSFPIPRGVAEKMLPEGEEVGPKAEDDTNDVDKKQVDEFTFAAQTSGRWTSRVAFKDIARGMDRAELDYSESLAALLAKARLSIEKQIATIARDRSFGNIDLKEFETVKIPKTLISKIRKLTRKSLKSVFDENYNRAALELPKKVNAEQIMGLDKTRADKFLASKSIKITDILATDILESVGQVLENGIKYDKSLRDIMNELVTDTKVVATLPETDAVGRAINIPARLENIARTNISDAVNQARSAYFGRPEFKGFILAYEYSAILDQRVTDICETLDGKIKRDWGKLAPPNHYQCRSILVPVTAIDDWDGKEDTIPASAKPLQGFK